MLSFSIRHSLSDIIGDPKDYIHFNDDQIDTETLVDPSQCILCGVSNDGYSILYQKFQSYIIFYQFTYFPPLSKKIYRGELDEGISNARLSRNNRFLSYATSSGHVMIADTTIESDPLLCLKDTTNCLPIQTTVHKTYYIFERYQNLYYTSISHTNPATVNSSRGSCIIRNISWWSMSSLTNHIAVITNKKKIFIYQFNEKIIEIYSDTLEKMISPTHFFVTSELTFVLCSINPSQASFYTFPQKTVSSYNFPQIFSYSQLITVMLSSLILVSAPNTAILIFDIEECSLFVIDEPSIINFMTPPALFNCSSSWSLFFSPESLSFYHLEFNWILLTKLLPQYLTFVSHIIGAHQPVTESAAMIILHAASKLNPIDLYHFMSEFLISSIHSKLRTKCKPICLKYIPYTNEYSNTANMQSSPFQTTNSISNNNLTNNHYTNHHNHIDHYNSLSNNNSISDSNHTSNNNSNYNSNNNNNNMNGYSGYTFSGLSILNMRRNLKQNENDIRAIILPNIDQSILQNWILFDQYYSPGGFWKQSTILSALAYIVSSKLPKNKLLYPLCDCIFPSIHFYSPKSEDKKQLRDLSAQNIYSFVDCYKEAESEISDSLALPEDEVVELKLLLIHFIVAKEYHLPFHFEKLRMIQSLAVLFLSPTMRLMMARFGLFQLFDKLNLKNFQEELELWVRSPYSKELSTEIINNNRQEWPTTYEFNMESIDEEKNNIFKPFVMYEKRTTGLNEDRAAYQALKKIEPNYSYENLLSIYI
ncbi:hypothetical protein TRFO_02374 [Tritrichomonas foetus]|uniref:Uncharacterized protein n=1 Tax=Tritrichomonas foetus TaxID=1144522 RepID=A0A1J4J315_9EUKA|nr:hypothetical protein TRFO_02374 [Tritrichomonas foetus]|eukprot:OHS93848.1 hypothetical protein TRFO_02374 [Tritrichomonas foetus]